MALNGPASALHTENPEHRHPLPEPHLQFHAHPQLPAPTTSVIIRGPSARSTTAATYGVRSPKGGRSLRWTTDQV